MKTIEEKAYSHVDKIFSEIIDKYQTAPWNEFRDALAQIYLAGATEALAGQWRNPKEELPKFGDSFILRYRTKYKGSWLTITEVEKRRDWSDPFNDKNKDVLAWMPIPEPPKDES